MRLLLGLLASTACVKPQVVTVPTTTSTEPATEEPEVADEGECGAERWDVKLGYDEAAAAVDVARPQTVDIGFLCSQASPPHILMATAFASSGWSSAQVLAPTSCSCVFLPHVGWGSS
jgi:hypothetical protein